MSEKMESKVIYLRITNENHAAMKKIASDENRTLTKQINHALSRWIDSYIEKKQRGDK